MTIGVGGSNIQDELKSMQLLSENIENINEEEYSARIQKAKVLMQQHNVDAIFFSCSTNLRYFINLNIHPSERLHGAAINKTGDVVYIVPSFEKEKTETMITFQGKIFTWEEDENPAKMVMDSFTFLGVTRGTIAIDENTPFLIFDKFQKANQGHNLINAECITKVCREVKSENEIAFIQTSMDITLEVQKRTARILYTGITTVEVQNFVSLAHQKLGSHTAPAFNIVLFFHISTEWISKCESDNRNSDYA